MPTWISPESAAGFHEKRRSVASLGLTSLAGVSPDRISHGVQSLRKFLHYSLKWSSVALMCSRQNTEADHRLLSAWLL